MSHDKAIVRKQVERIDGVTKAWFKWIYDEGELLKVCLSKGASTRIPTACISAGAWSTRSSTPRRLPLKKRRQWSLAIYGSCPLPKENPGKGELP